MLQQNDEKHIEAFYMSLQKHNVFYPGKQSELIQGFNWWA